MWLAASVGSLSLLLRKAGETAEVKTRKITLKDLGTNETVAGDKPATTTVAVTRASTTAGIHRAGRGASWGLGMRTRRGQVAW